MPAKKIQAAQHDSGEFFKYDQGDMLKMSHFWEDFYQDVLNRFNDINRDIIGELRRLHDGSSLETRAGSARGEGAFLHDCRSRDRLFGDIELGWFARVEYPALA